MGLVYAIGNEIRLSYFLTRRYWPESVAAFFAVLLVFLGLLHAVMALGDIPLSSGRLDGLILGYALWTFAGAAYASSANELAEEIRQRTLEQLCIGIMPLWAILAIRAVVKIGMACCVLLVLLVGVNAVADGRLHLNYANMMATMLLASPSLMGLGYMIAGCLLILRKAESVQLLVYPALIGTVAYPAYPLNAGALLPFALGASMTKQVAAGQDLPFSAYLVLGLISLAWLGAGLAIFRCLEKHARRLGIMGHI